MTFSQDWVMRQIEMLAQFLAKLLFGKETTEYIVEDEDHLSATDMLYFRLRQLIAEGKIGEAEDYLFAQADTSDRRYLEVAVDFYACLNTLSDETLRNADFSREEIEAGLKEITEAFDLGDILL